VVLVDCNDTSVHVKEVPRLIVTGCYNDCRRRVSCNTARVAIPRVARVARVAIPRVAHTARVAIAHCLSIVLISVLENLIGMVGMLISRKEINWTGELEIGWFHVLGWKL